MKTINLGNRVLLLALFLFTLTAPLPMMLHGKTATERPLASSSRTIRSPVTPRRWLAGRRGDSPRAGRDCRREES